MTCRHLRIEGITHAKGRNDTVEENGGLSDLRLLQILVGTLEHDVGDAISKNIICLLKKFLCQWVVVVKILTHTYKLCSLSGKNECFHLLFTFLLFRVLLFLLSGCKITTFF